MLEGGSINSCRRFSVFIGHFAERKLRMQLRLTLAHNLPAALRLSAVLPGQVMKSTLGQVTKILSVASAREGSSVLTDGHSIPGPRASPALCQELD